VTELDNAPPSSKSPISLKTPRFDEDGNLLKLVPQARFVHSQYASNAMRGAVGVDLFFGGGGGAEHLAGSLKEKKRYYLVLKKK